MDVVVDVVGVAVGDVEWDGLMALTRVANVNLTDRVALTNRKLCLQSVVGSEMCWWDFVLLCH